MRRSSSAPYAWVRANCPEGKDYNYKATQSQAPGSGVAVRCKDGADYAGLDGGQPPPGEAGLPAKRRLGHNAILSGFQGQRQWTDHYPNGDFLEALLNSSFDWNGIREPYLVATENDSLNGAGMLLGHLLADTAQVFADLRTYWSPEAVKRVTGHSLTGAGSGWTAAPHQFRSGDSRCLRQAW